MTSARDRDGATAHQYGRRSHHGLIQPTVRLATDPQMVLPPVLRPSIEETPRSWATSGLVAGHDEAELVVHRARAHDRLPAALVKDRPAGRPPVGAVVAHDWQQEELRAVQADHPCRLRGRAIHADVAADSADFGREYGK